MSEISQHIKQVIVLGRGVEINSDPFPGTVQPESDRSSASYDRAVTGARFALAHPEVDRVVFSGGTTFMLPEDEVPDGTEGRGMLTVAKTVYLGIPAGVEGSSRTTVGNFVESVRAGLLDPSETIAIVVDERQRKNAIWASRLVMPHAVFRVISAYDNPDLKTTLPDVRLSEEPSMHPTRNDRISYILYRVAMAGVTPGDLKTIQARDHLVQRNVLRVRRGIHTLRNVFKAALRTAYIISHMTWRRFLQSLTLTLFVFGFAGWFYIAENAVFHPVTLHMPLTHFWKYPHEDTFGAICFAVSFVSFFIYNYIKDEPEHS